MISLYKQRLIFVAFVFLFCCAVKTFACDCARLSTEQAIQQSEAVFSGEVIGFEYRKGIPNQFMDEQAKMTDRKIDYETLVVKVRVSKWWKGEPPTEVYFLTSKTRNSDGTSTISSCSYTFDLGGKYLIFATKYNVKEKNEYRTSECLPTRKLSAASDELKFWGEGKKTPEDKAGIKTVYVMGAVAKAGAFPLDESDTVSKVIDKAGGLSADADSSRIEICRRVNGVDNGDSTFLDLQEIKRRKREDIKLKPNDLIYVFRTNSTNGTCKNMMFGLPPTGISY